MYGIFSLVGLQYLPEQCSWLIWYPVLQVHVKLPSVLEHECSHPPLLELHSLTSGNGV